MKRTIPQCLTLLAPLALVITSVQSVAQNSNSNSNLPESMRIDQQADRDYYKNRSAEPSARTGTAPPAAAGQTAPGDRSRLDVRAPSRHQLQIDDGVSDSIRRNPDAVNSGNSGSTYNTILKDQPSTNSPAVPQPNPPGISGQTSPGITTAPSSGATGSSSGTAGSGSVGSSGGAAGAGSSGGAGGGGR